MITKLLAKLKDKARRELFVAGQIKTGIPFQIRALRDKYCWTQAELGERLGMTQTNISRLESPGYGKLSIATLQRLAAAFDVALVVRFVPFSRLINWVDNLSPEDMAPANFNEEVESLERKALNETTAVPDLVPISGIDYQITRLYWPDFVMSLKVSPDAVEGSSFAPAVQVGSWRRIATAVNQWRAQADEVTDYTDVESDGTLVQEFSHSETSFAAAIPLIDYTMQEGVG